mmetsp:Transcript_12012/g.18547  ORF Transcript_12012/g.18547 Transcript_12012/m.18547 type:complete len:139 (+) Transcript_12012:466-882(+)
MEGMEEDATPLRTKKEEELKRKSTSEIKNSSYSKVSNYQCLQQFPPIQTPNSSESSDSHFSEAFEKKKEEIIQEIEQSLSSLKPESHLSSETKGNPPSVVKALLPISPLAFESKQMFSKTFNPQVPSVKTASLQSSKN